MFSENYNTPEFITVGFVLCIIGYNYYIFTFKYIFTLIQTNVIEGAFSLIIFQVSVILLLWTYYKAIRTNPGYVPSDIDKSFDNIEILKERALKDQKLKQQMIQERRFKKKKVQTPQSGELQLELENKKNYESTNPEEAEKFDIIQSMSTTSYCFKCNKVKPARAHHCKDCKKCVLRMDHHCPWVANCVGKRNQKFFILFLVYATLSNAICCIGCVKDYLNNSFIANKLGPDRLYLTICGATTFALTMCIGFLLYFQLWCLTKNITTVESHIPELQTPKNPFLKPTWKENFQEIFGDDKSTWWIPVDAFTRERSDTFQYFTFENRV